MTQPYAAKTTVPVERSKAEIESLLKRYGADQFHLWMATRRGHHGFPHQFTTHPRHTSPPN